jgi:hypothetical protein
MKVKLKEDPKEWRKTTLLTALGLVLLGTVLRWRGILANRSWSLLLAVMALVGISAWLRPRWYRGFYRVSTRIGFHLSQAIARVILAMIFILLLAPLSLILRLTGNDPLQLKPRKNSPTYWHPAKESGPMDRLF